MRRRCGAGSRIRSLRGDSRSICCCWESPVSGDAANLETQLDAARKAGDATNLGSRIAADLQLRGPARVEWIDERYLRDRARSSPEIEAALLALSVHGNTKGRIPRERVIRSYQAFIGEHKDIAGLVAQDLAAWEYWEAVPEYVSP